MSKTGGYMPLWVGDYLRDTGHLSTAEHGAYLLLLLHAWEHDGFIPSDPDRIRNITKLPDPLWEASKNTLLDFWTLSDKGYHQKRLDAEIRRAKSKYKQAVSAGKSSAYKRALKRALQRGVNQSESESVTTTPKPKNNTRSASAFIRPAECPEQVWNDWLAVRKRKRLPNTDTAWAATVREATIAGLTPTQAVTVSAERGWGGFKAEWIAPHAGSGGNGATKPKQSATMRAIGVLDAMMAHPEGQPRHPDHPPQPQERLINDDFPDFDTPPTKP